MNTSRAALGFSEINVVGNTDTVLGNIFSFDLDLVVNEDEDVLMHDDIPQS